MLWHHQHVLHVYMGVMGEEEGLMEGVMGEGVMGEEEGVMEGVMGEGGGCDGRVSCV